jgi:LCP family protein required for cell wall assembly
MNEWPDGWNDGSRGGYGRGRGVPGPDRTRAMPHTPRQGVPPQGPGGYDGYGDYRQAGYDSGYSEGQVYGAGGGRAGYDDGRHGDGRYAGGRRPDWGRRVKWTVIVLVVVLLAWGIGTYFWADSNLKRKVDLGIVEHRPAAGDGTNYLIVGSDSREGMTAQEKKDLHTGSAEGKRTDSMMILHVADDGSSTVVSLPRDSWVEIPPFTGSTSGKHYNTIQHTKLNAAYAQDGATLLVRTVEHNTGLKIDHYAEIGFGGFAKIVDAVGGVEMNLPQAIKDKNSGADLKAGKQTLNGKQALAYVRTRHAFAQSDLQRTKNQQKFLSALAHETATPSTILNPFKLYPTLGAGLDSLTVDKDMSVYDLGSMFFAMKGIQGGEGKQMNMPISGPAPEGSLQWDMPKVHKLVSELNNDQKVTVKGNR